MSEIPTFHETSLFKLPNVLSRKAEDLSVMGCGGDRTRDKTRLEHRATILHPRHRLRQRAGANQELGTLPHNARRPRRYLVLHVIPRILCFSRCRSVVLSLLLLLRVHHRQRVQRLLHRFARDRRGRGQPDRPRSRGPENARRPEDARRPEGARGSVRPRGCARVRREDVHQWRQEVVVESRIVQLRLEKTQEHVRMMLTL